MLSDIDERPVYDALVSLAKDIHLKGLPGAKTRADAQAINC